MQHNSNQLPSVIDDAEFIVKAIKIPAHYDTKKQRLKPAAYRPPVGSTTISVMRQLIGDDNCKMKSVEICGDSYEGMLVIKAATIRNVGSTVVDAPADYWGHAHIEHPFPAPNPNEPLPASAMELATEHYRRLANASCFYKDFDVTSPAWPGPPLACDKDYI